MTHRPQRPTSSRLKPWSTAMRAAGRRLLHLRLFLLSLLLFLSTRWTYANTGGSGGGGSFGGGGGGSYSGGGSYGGGAYTGGGGGGYGGSVSSSDIMFVGVLLGAMVVASAVKDRGKGGAVYQLRFLINIRQPRPWESLESLVTSQDFRKPEGRAHAIREFALFLTRLKDQITHASYLRTSAKTSKEVEQDFRKQAAAARSQYTREVVRYDGMQKQSVVQTREVETDGLHDEDGTFGVHEAFVVTLIFATASRLKTVPRGVDTFDELHTCLDQLSFLSQTHVYAVEIVWSPAAESDILPLEEALERYPDLRELI